jgi:hypothetical protein
MEDLDYAISHERLKEEFPELQMIPKEAIYIDARRRSRMLDKYEDMLDQPNDLDDLAFRLELAQKQGLLDAESSGKKEERLSEIIGFLENKKNMKIYEGYLKSLNNEPKTLLLFPSLGFKGYLERMKELRGEEVSS